MEHMIEWADLEEGTVRPRKVDEAIREARRLLSSGRLLVSTTDTVFGLVASAHDPSAVARIAAVKGRSTSTPPPVVVGSVEEAMALVLTRQRARLAEFAVFWPGPLSLVVDVTPALAQAVNPEGRGVALRVPADAVLASMARTVPLAASSANLHGQPTESTVTDVLDQLAGGRGCWPVLAERGVAAGVAWAPPRPMPSTIVDLTGSTPRIVREGAIAAELLRPYLGDA